MPQFFWTFLGCIRGGCTMNIFSRLCKHFPSQNCPLAFPFTMPTLGRWRACGVWWADSPRAAELPNRRVCAPLKFRSAGAEIWGVKNCHFPPSSCIPERNCGKWPKPNELKDPVAEQRGGGSGTVSSALVTCSYGSVLVSLSSRVKSWGERSWAFGQNESTAHGPALGDGREGQREEAEDRVCPLHALLFQGLNAYGWEKRSCPYVH